MTSNHVIGLDVLGVGTVDKVITLRLRDPIGAARASGRKGRVAALAALLVPDAIAAEVYRNVAKEIEESMKDKGVDAEVAVLEGAPSGKVFRSTFVEGAAVGGGVVGLVWLLSNILMGGR